MLKTRFGLELQLQTGLKQVIKIIEPMLQNILSTFLCVFVTQQVTAVKLYGGVITEKNFGAST